MVGAAGGIPPRVRVRDVPASGPPRRQLEEVLLSLMQRGWLATAEEAEPKTGCTVLEPEQQRAPDNMRVELEQPLHVCPHRWHQEQVRLLRVACQCRPVSKQRRQQCVAQR